MHRDSLLILYEHCYVFLLSFVCTVFCVQFLDRPCCSTIAWHRCCSFLIVLGCTVVIAAINKETRTCDMRNRVLQYWVCSIWQVDNECDMGCRSAGLFTRLWVSFKLRQHRKHLSTVSTNLVRYAESQEVDRWCQGLFICNIFIEK